MSAEAIWTHRRVRQPNGKVRVREVYFDKPGEFYGYTEPVWRDFLAHPSWLWQALRMPIVEKLVPVRSGTPSVPAQKGSQ